MVIQFIDVKEMKMEVAYYFILEMALRKLLKNRSQSRRILCCVKYKEKKFILSCSYKPNRYFIKNHFGEIAGNLDLLLSNMIISFFLWILIQNLVRNP